MFVEVGYEDGFTEGIPRVVDVRGREIRIIRWRADVYALRNICPHECGPVWRGYAMPMILGQGGEVDVDDNRLVVVCPWHGWEFDAPTGRGAWGPSRYRLKTYPAKVEDGRISVDVGW